MIVRHVRLRYTLLTRGVFDHLGITEQRVASALEGVRRGSARHVLIAPPGAGNIGDQAMVEAFVAAADRPVTVVTRGPKDFTLPVDLAAGAEIVALPGLFYGAGGAHANALARLKLLLTDAATVSIVGADIMDGVYVLRSSLRRSAIAAGSARAGIDTTVLGFSWSGKAPAAALRALRRAGAAGVRLLLRDPASAARVRDAGIGGVVETADIVFTDDRRDDAKADGILRGIDGPFAIVNVSGLIARTVDQVPEYTALLDHLRADGFTVVLLPHVLRDTADDLTACREVYAASGGEGVLLIDEQLSPSTIRSLANRASLIVTGRMHLAIMSLAQGTPAITLATQGKVEGLMKLFGWPELCVAPGPGMGERIWAVASQVLAAPDARDRVQAGAARARALAAANIDRISGNDARERYAERNASR
ncbi:polysaccharide pyruvyl transferase family protein [Micromonospora sp. DT81.3]|uniref:polysaccharide pyruvyl transferase family protein n=1 Tax=Micromonospora sp. DT81.3 TaxID=3416523 RepID=UPI003CEAE6E4